MIVIYKIASENEIPAYDGAWLRELHFGLFFLHEGGKKTRFGGSGFLNYFGKQWRLHIQAFYLLPAEIFEIVHIFDV